ncbi:MAG: tryptophan 2,3-dioxygenase, partial [Proteobacteria bacterium]|nr:tryptophan 2,3-dioxygenase [Pseudomonadota bacterium]
VSDSHDEILFIIIHQASELWMKLIIHELKAACAAIQTDALGRAFKMSARVSRIQNQMIQSWDVLSTMTPAEYLDFRGKLGRASGFQSYQYRTIEFLLGAKDAELLAPHRHRPDIHGPLEHVLKSPSLYDEAIRLLARRGFAIERGHLGRDLTLPYAADASVKAAWIEVYRDTAKYWDLYELAEELVDVEDSFQVWRFRHMMTVQRIIGFKAGTGGTAGVGYLKQAVGRPFFPELWDLRTEL